jgi:uncharacterized protein (DUF58 family)
MSEPAATPKVVTYAALTGIGLLAAVVFGDGAIVALAAPFGFALVLGLLAPVDPLPEIHLALDALRLVEGGRATIALELSATSRVSRCDIALALPAALAAEVPTAWSLRLDPGSPVVIEVPITAASYGRFVVGPARAHVSGLFGMLSRAGEGGTLELEVRPKAEALRTLVRARDVRATAGDRLARRPGDGIEFAEVRPYAAGTPGRLNWRMTARRGEPYVNLRHPERSTDLILLVDTFSASALPRQVRAASGLAAAYLSRHDRVGLVAFGGVLHWVEPAMGRAQLERVVAALTTTEWHHSYAWKSAETIPSRALPRTGLVIAISPLEDPRLLNALATIRARGVDLAVIEPTGPRRAASSAATRSVAGRIIDLERAEMRLGFGRRGVPIVAWQDGDSLEAPLAALAVWRRQARGRGAR